MEYRYIYMFLCCSKGTGNKYTYLCLMNEMKGSMHTVTEPGKKVDELCTLKYCYYKNVALI